MKKHLSLTLSLMLALTLSVAFTGCGGQSDSEPSGAADADQGSASEAAPAAKDEPAPDAGSATEAAPEAAPAAAEAAGEAITAENLVGTKWKLGDVASFTFEPEGVLKVNDAIPGEWSIADGKLTVSAMGATYVAEIDGAKLLYNGEELLRQ
ncbi:MAG: hypothetical protein GY851_00060 [bacterium]|nr:hypothetical protein [bacterium]